MNSNAKKKISYLWKWILLSFMATCYWSFGFIQQQGQCIVVDNRYTYGSRFFEGKHVFVVHTRVVNSRGWNTKLIIGASNDELNVTFYENQYPPGSVHDCIYYPRIGNIKKFKRVNPCRQLGVEDFYCDGAENSSLYTFYLVMAIWCGEISLFSFLILMLNLHCPSFLRNEKFPVLSLFYIENKYEEPVIMNELDTILIKQ